ncbi:MAG: hemerythrin domain-containing protein [Rhodospirillaceae bacterium]
MNIVWDKTLETGVDIIDTDHHAIIEFYNRVYQYYVLNTDELIIERAISDFSLQFSMHFLREENFMASLQYPEFESHAKEHEIMMNLLNRATHYSPDTGETCQKIAFLVLQWISSHLEGADRRLAEFSRLKTE